MKIFTVLLPLILIAVMIVWMGFLNNKKLNKVKDKSFKVKMICAIAVSAISFLTLVFVPASIHQIEAGQVAVVKVWGEAKETRSSGIYFDNWISNKYEIYDIKTQEVKINSTCYSNDGQTMDIELVVQYQIQPENAVSIATQYGSLDTLESKISTVSLEKTKSVLSQKSAMKIIETRAEVSPAVEEAIKNSITNEYYVNITTVVLTDISFTDEFENTVENKMIAEQEKLKAQYEKEKAIIQAEQELEVAKLEAKSQIEKAQGEAKSIEEMAKAQANSIKKKSIEVARMLGFNITETVVDDETVYDIDFTGKTDAEIKTISEYLKYIEYLEVWDGKLPEVVAGDTATVVIPTP